VGIQHTLEKKGTGLVHLALRVALAP